MKLLNGFLIVCLAMFLSACEKADDAAAVVTDEASEAQQELASVEPEVDPLEEARKAAEQMAKEIERAAEETKLAGEAYLHINAQKPGVKVLESGLQFRIIESGTGKSPGPTSNVLTHYHGTLTNGEIFDSSVERGEPAQFPVNRVIAGWVEALQMMKEGDTWELVIPPELAYGNRQVGDRIPANSVLIFEVELIEVVD